MSSIPGTSTPGAAAVQLAPPRTRAPEPAAGDGPGLRLVGLALALALVFSTQFFAQPFVWRHWEPAEVLWAWLGILGERGAVALAIAGAVRLALALFARRPALAPGARAAIYTGAVVVAVVVAEILLVALDTADAAGDAVAFGEHVLRWCGMALAITGLRLAWQRAVNAEAAADRIRQADQGAQSQLAALRLQTLQSQIEPHFLFNTLATVRRLGATEPVQCLQLLKHLVSFVALSQAAQPGGRRWRVADELELVRAYLSVIELRMEGRLRVRFDVDPQALGQEAPPLALATLVENAVKHGITPSTTGGQIEVRAHLGDGQVRLAVADTGVGLRQGGGSGIGLANTRARLRSLHGDAARLRLAAHQPSGVVATLQWPLARGQAR
ncbi:MAG: histidine kinase [Rubrivivax sp.]